MYLSIVKTFRKIIFFLFILTIIISAQGTIIPLMQDGWVGGLIGNLGWDNYTINTSNQNGDVDSKAKGFGFIINSLNGRLVEDNAVLGFDLQWEQNSLTTTPQSKPERESYTKKRLGFVGFGATMFVSNNIAFEATGRYQGGTLKGNYEVYSESLDNLEIKLSNIDILFGIMIYMR